MIKLYRKNDVAGQSHVGLTFAVRGRYEATSTRINACHGMGHFIEIHPDVETLPDRLKLDYFSETAISKRGLEMETVEYQRPGALLHHEYNPVTHYKVNGTCVVNMPFGVNRAYSEFDLGNGITNLYTGDSSLSYTVLGPGREFARTRDYRYTDISGIECETHYRVSVRTSPVYVNVYTGSKDPGDIPTKAMIADYVYAAEGANIGRDGYFHGTIYYGSDIFVFGISDNDPTKRNRNYVRIKLFDGSETFTYNGHHFQAAWCKFEQHAWTVINTVLHPRAELLIKHAQQATEFFETYAFDDRYGVNLLNNSKFIGGLKWSRVNDGYKSNPMTILDEWNWNKFEPLMTTPNGLWNNLCYQCLQDIGEGAQVNGIAYVKDAIELAPTVKSFIKTLKSIPSKKVKAVASAWLAVHFGFKLMIADTKELKHELETSRSYGLSNVRSSTEVALDTTSVVYRYQIIFDRYRKIADAIGDFARKYDLALSLENWWDMVPFSFIIDWFVSVGDLLNAFDNFYNVRSHYTTAAAGQSIKAITSVYPGKAGISGGLDLEVSLYKRAYSKSPVTPVPGDHTVTVGPLHWVEGAALIIANS